MRLDYHEAETLETVCNAANREEVEDEINQGKQAKQAGRRQRQELLLRWLTGRRVVGVTSGLEIPQGCQDSRAPRPGSISQRRTGLRRPWNHQP